MWFCHGLHLFQCYKWSLVWFCCALQTWHLKPRLWDSLASRLWDWPVCGPGFGNCWVLSIIVELPHAHLLFLATSRNFQGPLCFHQFCSSGLPQRWRISWWMLVVPAELLKHSNYSWRTFHSRMLQCFLPTVPYLVRRLFNLYMRDGIINIVCVNKQNKLERQILCGYPNCQAPQASLTVSSTEMKT